MVGYDAYATLDRDGMDWYGQLYCLSASPDIPIPEMAIGNQHIRPLPFPERAFFTPAAKGPGRGRGRAGRGAGRGRAGAGKGGGAAGGDAGIEDAEPPAGGAADEPMDGDGGESAEGSESMAEGLSDDEDDDSGDSVATELIDKELEVGEAILMEEKYTEIICLCVCKQWYTQ